MKTDVYSWRVSPDLKSDLEREARRRKISLAAVLDLAARDWLNKTGSEIDISKEQARLQNAAITCFGTFASGDAHRSEAARERVRKRLKLRHGR